MYIFKRDLKKAHRADEPEKDTGCHGSVLCGRGGGKGSCNRLKPISDACPERLRVLWDIWSSIAGSEGEDGVGDSGNVAMS